MKRVTRKKSAKPTRSTPSQSAGAHTEPADLQEACSESTVELLLSSGMEFLLARGCTKAVLVRQLEQATRALTTGARSGTRRVSMGYSYMNRAGGVLRDWCTDCNYVDAEGKPLALTIGGPAPSLERLVGQQFPRDKIQWAIQWMEKAGFFTRRGDGLYVPQTRSAIFLDQNSFTTERSVTLATQVLSTALHNASCASEKRTLNFDRDARVPNIALKHLNRFRTFLNVQGQAFLEIIDDWLENHRTTAAGEPTTEVSVHLYLHTPAQDRKKKRRPINA